MLVPWRALKKRHHATAQCAKGAERKRRWIAEAGLRESTESAFEAYGKPLDNVSSFNYLRRVMTSGDDDWPEVAGNLSKAWESWGRLSRILCREGADARVSGKFSRRRYRRCFCLGRIRGYLTRGWSRPWIASSTRPRAGSPGDNHREGGAGAGRILL